MSAVVQGSPSSWRIFSNFLLLLGNDTLLIWRTKGTWFLRKAQKWQSMSFLKQWCLIRGLNVFPGFLCFTGGHVKGWRFIKNLINIQNNSCGVCVPPRAMFRVQEWGVPWAEIQVRQVGMPNMENFLKSFLLFSANYHLCQMCFWRGNMDEAHRDDVFKEYSVWKTPGKPSGLRRSMRCVPSTQQKRLPRFPDKPEQTLDLANIVPASPLPAHNGFHSEPGSRHMSPAISGSERLTMTRTVTASPHLARRTNQFATLPQPRVSSQQEKSSQRSRNEEHDLIARYANHLAGQSNRGEYGNRTLESSPEDELSHGVRGVQRRDKSRERGREPSTERKDDKNSRRLVHELELKNAEIMREIARLRQNRATVQVVLVDFFLIWVK